MVRPPRSKTRKMSDGGITCQVGSGIKAVSAPRSFWSSVMVPGGEPGDSTFAGLPSGV